MEKYIFLDIDGVLACPDAVKDGEWSICPKRQALLGKILEQTKAKIVLSSSWRKHDLKTTQHYMQANNFLYAEQIVGITIRAYHYIEKGQIHLSIPRGVEIKQWIDANIHSDGGKNYQRKRVGQDFNYCIIDDDCDMILNQANHFFKTDSEIGLTEEIANKIIEHLNTYTNEPFLPE